MIRMEDLSSARPVCKSCGLYGVCATPFMSGRGRSHRPLLAIVGDYPSQYEDKSRLPFYGGGGDLVREVLRDLGVVPTRDCWLTNSVRCKPFEKIKDSQVKACREFLIDELLHVDPVVIVCMGASAVYSILGKKGIKDERGVPRKVTLQSLSGGGEYKEFTVIPTIHAAQVLRNASTLKVFVRDLEKAVKIAREGGAIPEPPTVNYRVVATAADAEEFKAEIRSAKRFAWDTETTGLNPFAPGAKIVCATFSTKPGSGWLIPLHTIEREDPTSVNLKLSFAECEKLFRWALTKIKREVIGQNLKFDELFVRATLGWQPRPAAFDTGVAYHLLSEEESQMGANGLKSMAWEFTLMGGYETPFLEKYPHAYDGTMDRIPLMNHEDPKASLLHYACGDVDVTMQVYEALLPRIKEEELEVPLKLEMQKLQLLVDMEFRGARIDWELHSNLMTEFPRELERIKDRLRQFPEVQKAEKLISGGGGQQEFLEPDAFNPNSPQQVQTLCMAVLQLPRIEGKQTSTGKQSVDAGAIEIWCRSLSPNAPAAQILNTIREYKQMQKLFSTYVDPLVKLRDENGFIHTTFKSTGTITWRLASANPNLMNLPRADDGREGLGKGSVKALFVGGEPGWWVMEADYSQIELRILALVAQDELMIETYVNGADIHTSTASRVFRVPPDEVSKVQRTAAKTVNFGIVYGQTAEGLADSLRISKEEAESYIGAFYGSYTGVADWMSATRAHAGTHGWVKSLFGHRRHVNNVFSGDMMVREKALRQAVNSVIQGTASNMAIYAEMFLNKLFQQSGLRSYCFGQVHDSIWITGPPEEQDEVAELVVLVMENLPFEFLTGDHPDYPNVPPIVADLKVGMNLRDMTDVVLKKGG